MAASRLPTPSVAAITIARRIGGSAITMSVVRISTESVQLPKNPVTAPTAPPISNADTITAAATGIDARAP